MNVLVIGANGRIGQHLVRKLQESDEHNAIAMVRKEEQQAIFVKKGVKTALVDLEGSIEDISRSAMGMDAVVFTAGARGHEGVDKFMMVDLDGAVKSMKAAEQAGVKRFINVSGNSVHRWHDNNHPEWMDSYPTLSAAKYYADAWLQGSTLDYTIIRPGNLIDEPGTGKVKVARDIEIEEIPREDVATAIIATLDNDQTIGKAFDMNQGATSIAEAINLLDEE